MNTSKPIVAAVPTNVSKGGVFTTPVKIIDPTHAVAIIGTTLTHLEEFMKLMIKRMESSRSKNTCMVIEAEMHMKEAVRDFLELIPAFENDILATLYTMEAAIAEIYAPKY